MFAFSSEVVKQEILRLLLYHAKLPTDMGKITAKEDILKTLLKDVELWSFALAIENELTGIPILNSAREVLNWFKEAVAKHDLRLGFVLDLTEKEVSLLSHLSAVTDVGTTHKDAQKWKMRIQADIDEASKVNAMFEKLESAITFVQKAGECNELQAEDWKTIIQAVNKHKKEADKMLVSHAKDDSYWGQLLTLVDHADAIWELKESTMFLNVARICFKEKQQEHDGFSSTTEDLMAILGTAAVERFQKVCNPLFDRFTDPLVQDLQSLMDDIKSELHLDKELKFLCSYFHRRSVPCRQKLLDYLKFPVIQVKAEKLIEALHVFGYDPTEEEFFTELKSCCTDLKDMTLSHLSERVNNLSTVDETLDEDLSEILSSLSKSSELISFMDEIANEDILFLIDAVEEHSDQSVSESTVSDLIDVHKFLGIVLKNKPEGPLVFFQRLQEGYDKLERKSAMAVKINHCSCNVHSLRGLYMNVANRGEMTKEIISNALSKGCYQLGTSASGSWDATLSYERQGEGNKEASYSLADLHDLRSRALLIVNTDKKLPNKEDDTQHIVTTTVDLSEFVTQIDLITESLHMCEQLQSSGHPKYKKYWVKLNSTDKIRSLAKSLEVELRCWRSVLELVRKEFFYLNYFHADQLWDLEKFFTEKTSLDSDVSRTQAAFDLLRFIDPSIQFEDVVSFKSLFKKSRSTEDLESDLRSIGEVLDNIFKSRKSVKKPKSPKRQLQATVKLGKVFVAVLQPGSTQTVQVVMSLFENTIGSVPQPSQVLFCHPETSWEEVERLLHRTFEVKNQLNAGRLHCLANVDSLPNDMQFDLVATIKKLQASTEASYLLSLVCCGGQHHHIVDQFSDSAHHIGGMTETALTKRLITAFPKVYMVTSDLPGLGKTETVYEDAASKGRSVVTFPISGPLSRRKLVKRLSALHIMQHNCIHFEIGEVDDPLALDTFLFELVVVGMVSSGTQVYHIPTEYIYIEIANTLKHWLRDSLPVTKCFQRKDLTWQDYENVVVSQEVTSSIQVVCHYLHAYETSVLENKELVFTGTSKLKPLEPKRCRDLLSKYFSSGGDLTFNIIECFINVFSDQLLKFSASPFFKPRNLRLMVGASHDVRNRMFKALLEVSREFAARSVVTCKAVQAEAITKEQAAEVLKKIQLDSAKTAMQMVERVEGMIQWADNNHLLVIFNSLESHTVSALYRDLTLVPKSIKDLFKSQALKGKGTGLDDFAAMNQEQLQSRLDQIARTSPRKEGVNLNSLAYALTPDNILKMALIIQRIRARIPVIIMGETGCGKTSLVRYLARTCDVPFHVFNFHAGIKEEQVVEFVLEKNTEAQESGKGVWIFLDEINTCEYLGIVNEIICHRNINGKPLSANLVFIAACNPYRLRPSGAIATAGLEGKVTMDERSRLVYRVHPLPETMIDYVWDYGSLSPTDERAYIGRMVEGLYAGKFQELLIDLLASSQDHIRLVDNSPYCVSLRDVHRCTVLMKWFYNTLCKRPEFPLGEVEDHVKGHFSEARKLSEEVRSIVLALAHCYQSRISTAKAREEYRSKMSNVFGKHCNRKLLEKEFEAIVRAEQEEYLARMELPDGTARNAALRENVFVMLVCILNHIPVFVVGKPGCSKSLSMQVIRSNLRGKDMKDPFLKSLPQLYVVSYQGSESSTSEGIEKVFEKARKYKEYNDTSDVLPVVLLDEIGLAEISKYNPLKVLHSLLEPADGDFPDVAVVGISNWALDAAKMNRAIHLSRPEPDVKDLYETGLSIRHVHVKAAATRSGKQYQAAYSNDKQLQCLAEAYHEYQTTQSHENFHGLRDYYSLIKSLSAPSKQGYSLTELEEEESKRCHRALQRNFGGLPTNLCKIQCLFVEKLEAFSVTQKSHSFIVTDLIRENLFDKNARHLMLITNGDSAIGILDQTLQSLDKEKITIFGSRLEEDLSEDYSYRILSRIILCMETDCVLILRDLEGIYGSLYDMLNQNYTVVGGKKNCRVALGPFSNPICQVHDGFRCIVLVDQPKVDLTDPPFLNRFEKQLLRFSDVLSPEQRETIHDLQIWVKDISAIPEIASNFSEKDMFVGFHEDTLPSLVLHNSQAADISKEEVLDKCKKDLMWVASPDGALRSLKSRQADNDVREVRRFYRDYFDKPIHKGLAHFLDHSIKSCGTGDPKNEDEVIGMKFLVMTHSNIHTNVMDCLDGQLKCQVEKLSSFKSEKQLTKQLQQFWDDPAAELLVLQCKPDLDATHMLLAKTIIEQQRREFSSIMQASSQPRNKHVCIIVHEQRTSQDADVDIHPWQFNFLCGWRQVMIDVLEEPILPINSLLNLTVIEVLNTAALPFSRVAADQLLWCFTRIKYPLAQESQLDTILQLENRLRSLPKILGAFKELVNRWITKKQEEQDPDPFLERFGTAAWQVSVASDRQSLVNCSTLAGAMQQHISHLVRQPLAKIIYFLDRESAWVDSIRGDGPVDEEELHTWVNLLLDNSIFNMDDIPEPQGAESYVVPRQRLALQYPFAFVLFNIVEGVKDFFLEELRCIEMEEDNFNEDGELAISAVCSLQHRFAQVVEDRIPKIFATDFLKKKAANYLEDVLDIKSAEVSPKLSRDKRIAFLKAACAEHMRIPAHYDDVSLLFTQLHSIFWMEGAAFMSAIHLFLASQMVSISLDDLMVELIVKFNRSLISPPQFSSTHIEGSDLEDSMTMEEEKEQEDEGLETFQSFTEEEQSATDETKAEGLVIGNKEAGDSCKKDEDPGQPTQKDKADENVEETVDKEKYFAEDGQGGEALLEGEATYMTQPEQCDQRFQEALVDAICVAMFPTQSVVTSLGGVSGWSQAVSLLLSLMSRMGSDIPPYHYLRLCHDFATVVILPESLQPFSLFMLGELGRTTMEDDVYLDSQERFHQIYELVEDLRTGETNDDKLEEFLVLLYGRCIDSNPDTPVLGSILDAISTTTDKTMLKFVGPVIHRLLWTEETMNPGVFEEVLKNPDALEKHAGLDDINKAFSRVLEEDAEVELDFPCAVMSCDLVGEVAFQGIDLTAVSESEDPLLVHLRTAARIVTDSDEDEDIFRLLCAVANLRASLSSVARLIQAKPSCLLQDGEFSMLLNDVNAVIAPTGNSPTDPRKSAARMFLLRELRKKLPLDDLRELCRGSVKLPALKAIQWQVQDPIGKLSFDPFEVLTRNTQAQTALASLFMQKAHHQMTDVLKTLKEAGTSRLELAAVLIKHFYLVRSTRSLKEREKKDAESIKKGIEAEGLPKPFTDLLVCVLGMDDFKTQKLNISAESTSGHVHRTALILHLGAILASHLGHDKSLTQPFLSYFMDPLQPNGKFVLAAPEDPKVGYQIFKYYTGISTGVHICLCSCGVAFADASEKEDRICPFRQGNSKATASDQAHQVQVMTPATKGYVLQGEKEIQKNSLYARDLAPAEFRILHLLVHTAVYVGYALKLFDDDVLRKFLFNTTQHEEASDACFGLMLNDLQVLCNLLNVEEEDVLRLMHCVLEVTTPLLTQRMQLTSEASRSSWERRFAEAVAPLLHESGTAKWKSNTGEACQVSQPSVEQQLSESHIHAFEDTKSRSMHLPRLFRATQPKTFDSLRAFYLNTNDQVKKKHPLFGLFLDHLHTLPLIGHLSNLLDWSHIVDSQLSRRLSRTDAKMLKIGDVIRDTRASKEPSDRKSSKNAFDNFKQSWEEVRPLVMKELESKKSMPHLSETSPIACCLVERQEDGVFLCTALELLQKLQNGFLEKVLAISSTGACAALSFLQKGDSVSAISMVHLQDARKKEIIHYQWTDEILRHSQRDTEYGRGNEIFYDLGKIEKELAVRLLPGKAYLSTRDGLRKFVFSKELFHTCSNILNDLQQIIPQTCLTGDIKKGLCSLKERNLGSIQVLLEHLEIVLFLLKRTGGNQEESLTEFTDRWLSNSRPFPKLLLPEPRPASRLKHVVALYECLEDILAESSADSVPDMYREPLLEDVKDQMTQMVTPVSSPGKSEEILSLDAIITALCRFMFRYLSSEDMRPDPGKEDLAESMMEPSLWPMGSFKEETQQQVRRFIPSSLTIGHVHSVFSFYQEHFKVSSCMGSFKALLNPTSVRLVFIRCETLSC